jgi:hypothetical protein
MNPYLLIMLCAVGFALGALPYIGFAYNVGIAVAYLVDAISLFEQGALFTCVAVGGGCGWLVLYFDKVKYADNLGWRSLALWNAISALIMAAFSYVVYLVMGDFNGFMGIYIASAMASAFGVAIISNRDK